MAEKSKNFTVDYDESLVGDIATLSDSTIRSLENSTSVRLRRDLTYVVIPQWVHDYTLKRPIGDAKVSKKVFVFGLNDKNEIENVLTLSVNGLRQSHYGRVSDNPKLAIASEVRDGLNRATSGTSMSSVFKDGALPLRKNDAKQGYIDRPFAFKVIDRDEFFVTGQMKKVATGWDMPTETVDGKSYIKIVPQTLNIYQEVYGVGSDLNEDVVKAFAPKFAKFVKNLPTA